MTNTKYIRIRRGSIHERGISFKTVNGLTNYRINVFQHLKYLQSDLQMQGLLQSLQKPCTAPQQNVFLTSVLR